MADINRENNLKWTHDEWGAMQKRLEGFSIEELKLLAGRVGVTFEGGVDSLKDREQMTVKDQIIFVLDEVAPADLKRECEAVERRELIDQGCHI